MLPEPLQSDLHRQYAAKTKADVAIVSDLYVVLSDCSLWLVSSGTQRAAIWLAGSGVSATDMVRDPEFVSARINGVHMFSCYASPNNTLADFTDLLQRMEDGIRGTEAGVPVLIAGDFNARTAVWGDWCQDV